MLMRPVLARVIMGVYMGRPIVRVLMKMFMRMLMGMSVLMAVCLPVVGMLVGMRMSVVMLMQMLVFALFFHCESSLQISSDCRYLLATLLPIGLRTGSIIVNGWGFSDFFSPKGALGGGCADGLHGEKR